MQEHVAMSRFSRLFRVTVLVVVTVLAWAQPEPASAWCGRWRGGFWGVGYRPWCGPVFGPRVQYGWGGWYGGTRFAATESVYLGGPFGGFFSGGVRSCVVGPPWWGPGFCGPGWGGWYGLPQTYYPYPVGYGWYGAAPIVLSPFGGSIAPVYGPAGVMPFMFRGAATNAAVERAGAVAAHAAAPLPAATFARRWPAAQPAVAAFPQPAPAGPLAARIAAASPVVVVRASNGAARLRAARLVAVGDRHLRTAVQDRVKLSAALDAYRRAATIAADQPDTFLRQAIVLTALDRPDDATRAIERAVAIDARLGPAPTAAVAARERARLPPDPVFGDRPDTGPTTLSSRSAGLLVRIFREEGGDAARGGAAADAANWIADRWSRRWQGAAELVAAR